MDPVSVASGIAGLITLALQVSGTIHTYVVAIKDKLKNIKELHDELLLLGEVLSRLQDFLVSEQAKGISFDKNCVLQKAIVNCKARIERIGDKLTPTEGGRIARALDRMRWPFEQQDVIQMIDNLRRFRDTFQFALTIENCNVLARTSELASQSLQEMLDLSKQIAALSARIGKSAEENALKQTSELEHVIALMPVVASTADEVREISNAMKMAEVREQERHKADILNWLAPVTSLHKHRDVQAKRAEGTGQWFLNHHDFRSWIDDHASQRDFLCVGGPGVGKSVLCSLVVDQLKQQFDDQDVAVAHYYCDYSEQHLQTPTHLVRSILRQLCAQSRIIPSVVVEFYQKTRNDISDQTWFQACQNVLKRVIATFSKFFLVIDAFDETDVQRQRNGLLDVLNAIKSARSTTKIFATTRPLPNIENKFHLPVRVQVSATKEDLHRYLSDMIKKHDDSDHIFDDTLKEEAVVRISENANGMFLLAALHIRTILDQLTRSDVRKALSVLSADLNFVFNSTIERIHGLPANRRDIAFKTLMWVSHAKRPLTVEELQHALAIRSDDSDIDRDNFLSLKTILDSCCGLAEFDQDSGIIRLVHFSLEEFLQSQDHELFDRPHLNIARCCLKYMSLNFVRRLPNKSRTNFDQALNYSPFLEYACNEWGSHARNVSAEHIEDLAIPLLINSNYMLAIARVRDARTSDLRGWQDRMRAWAFNEPERAGAGISLAASCGATDVLRTLLRQIENPFLYARNMYGSTGLHEAAICGYEDTVELLVSRGADLLDKNRGKSTPFFLAISYGRLSMAKKLLQYDRRQLDELCRDGATALHKAVDLGAEAMVMFLLQEGALVAAHDARGMTPLHIAAVRGYYEIAKMLVLAAAPVHVKANDKLCPLDLAASGGHCDLVELLSNNGGDIEHAGDGVWTPLQRAARNGHASTVRFLLERGANVLYADPKSNIALHLAARSGHLGTIQVLLNFDPQLRQRQIFHKDRNGGTAREVAFYTANYDVHKYLRANEWDILGTPSTRENEIATAIEKGDTSRVRELLFFDNTDLEAPDEDGQPPLHVAIQESQLEIATLLLSLGTNINSSGYHGWRPLHIAASLASIPLVNLCLDYGAEVSSRSVSLQTPLHKAASSKLADSLETVKRLIAAGANPNLTNDRGMTSLHVSAYQNNLETVRYLIHECGVDVMARDKYGQTAAQWAERGVHLQVLALLREEEKKARMRTKNPDFSPSSSAIGSIENTSSQQNRRNTRRQVNRAASATRTPTGAIGGSAALDHRPRLRYTNTTSSLGSTRSLNTVTTDSLEDLDLDLGLSVSMTSMDLSTDTLLIDSRGKDMKQLDDIAAKDSVHYERQRAESDIDTSERRRDKQDEENILVPA